MKPKDLIGRVMRVVEADDYRILLEDDDGGGISTNRFTLIETRNIGDNISKLEVSNLVKK